MHPSLAPAAPLGYDPNRPNPLAQADRLDRAALGTAQLGQAYGVANRSGRPDEAQAQALVAAALARGLNWFDTAAAYGESEAVLGRAFAAGSPTTAVEVVSKGDARASGGETLATRVAASLRRLQIPRLRAWLVHDENQLSAWTGAVAAQARDLQAAGRVSAFGLSAYHPDCALRAVEDYGMGVVQFPGSPLDRRFLRASVLGRLARSGARLFVRSVYLQGLCLLPSAEVPATIFRGREAVQTLHDFCARHGIAPDRFCLHYVLQRTADAGARLVIGLETRAQLDANLAHLAAPGLDPQWLDEWDALWPDDPAELVLPTHWRRP
jgi:aryl-alcohol dehydrogenase-like predicted oxidoreductase